MFNKTKIMFISSTILLTACALIEQRSPVSGTRHQTSEESINSVKINNQTIKIEIADTAEKHYQGLSFRKELCADCGMLFKFNEKSEKTFVMRNMNFPLDIIFIDNDKIIKIEKNLQPEGENPKNLYSSEKPTDYVLEVNGEYSDKQGIKVGDNINYFLK